MPGPVSRYTPSTANRLGPFSAGFGAVRAKCPPAAYFMGHEYVGNPAGIGNARDGFKRYFNENDFTDAAAALHLYLPPTAVYTAIVHDLATGLLVEPGPVIYLQLNDLSSATVTALVAAIVAVTP